MTRLSKEERTLDKRYRDGCRREPESTSVGRAGEKLAAEVWPLEIWRDSSTSRQRRGHGKGSKQL